MQINQTINMYHIKSVNRSAMNFFQEFSYSEVAETVYQNSDQFSACSTVTSVLCNSSSNIPVKKCLGICGHFNHYSNSDVTNNMRKDCYTAQFYPDFPDNNQNTIRRNFGKHFCSNKLSGVTKTIKKRKRKRTMFTTEQIIALEEVFHKKPYINRAERIAMTRKLKINEKSIKVWFQNRRRLTDQRSKDYIYDSPSSEDKSDTVSDRLTVIESQIEQNTDGDGYVTLDNKTMSELVNVIDEYLSHDFISVKEAVHPVTSECKVIYEPISPVSLTESLDDCDERREFCNQEAVQFQDLKSILFYQ